MDALFITINDLKRDSALNGNIDPDKLIPSLATAQQLEIEPILGTQLYNKLSDGIVSGSLSEPYVTLKNKYIQPVLIHFAVSYYLPYSTYIMSNGGTSKWNGGENYTALETADLNILMNKEKSLAENYKFRLINHLQANTTLYPELSSNTEDDITPSTDSDLTGWFLD